MKKIGFTLVEVLITLSIVGVVAAITLPALINGVGDKEYAQRLSVAVSSVENAMGNMLVKESATTLFDTDAWVNRATKSAFAGYIGQYLNTTGYVDKTVANYYSLGPFAINTKGEAGSAVTIGDENSYIIEMKNGIAMIINTNAESSVDTATQNAIISKGGSLFNVAAEVYFDVNGKSEPNILGRDIFAFKLGEDGILYPYGGIDVAVKENQSTPTNLWDGSGTYACLPKSASGDGKGCAARIIANGYKMNY